MAIGLLVALFALWRRWLPSWWAWLAAVLSMNVSRIETRMFVYKPEAVALMLVIWSTWLLDEALERRSPRWGGLAGIVLASAFLAHPVGSLLAAPLWGGVLVGRALPALRARMRPAALRSLLPALRPLLPALVVFALLFGGLRTAIGSTGQDLAQSPDHGVDLTRVVYDLAYVSSNPQAHPRVPECGDLFGVYSTVRPFYSEHASWFFFDLHATSSVLLIVGGLIVLGGVFLLQAPPRLARWPAAAKRGAITWCVFGIGVYLLAILICSYYSTWVPERVGPMRIMPYWGLIFPGLIVGAGWAAAALASRRRLRGALAFPGQARLLGGGVGVIPAVAMTVIATWTFTSADARRERGVPPFYVAEPRVGGLSDEGRAVYRWIAANLPRRATILTNGFIEGALGMLSHRSGLLDGRAPFAQPDPWRAEAIDMLAESRAFFKRPRSTPIPAGASYVLASRADVNLGGSYFPTSFRGLARIHALVPVHRTAGTVLYRVRHPRPLPAHRSSGQLPVTSTRKRINFPASPATEDNRMPRRATAADGVSPGSRQSC